MKRFLILEDGRIFEGTAFGADLNVNGITGELVFSTGMTGYQESITDQSYNGQILTFTYPLVGNYGINRDDYESIIPTCKAVVVRENARLASNWRSQMSLDEFLQRKHIPGIAGIDTRALTRIIRQHGTMKAVLINGNADAEIDADLKKLQAQLPAVILPNNQVAQVSTQTAYPSPGTGRNIVVVDFGLKHSILRELSKRDCNLTIVPHTITAEEIIDMDPDGIMLTNGPGDPTDVPEALDMIRGIQEKFPIFGICLGHQLIAMANGATTSKMKFGHRGFNHAVRELATGRVYFTSQNHGYAVDAASLDHTELELTHIEINDKSVEGVRHKYLPAFSVQFHPDAAPGPHDAAYLFDEFMEMIDATKLEKGNF